MGPILGILLLFGGTVLIIAFVAFMSQWFDNSEDRQLTRKRRVKSLEARHTALEQQVIDHITIYGSDPFTAGLLATLRDKKKVR